MALKVTHLENLRKDFVSEEAFASFVGLLRDSMKSDGLNAYFFEQELIGAVLSPTAAKEALSSRIREKLLTSPKLLNEILESLESDDIVE
jgi:hypothetical protein